MRIIFKNSQQKRGTTLSSRNRRGFIPLETETRCESSRSLTGFTMIELLVAMTLFITIMSIVSVIFITAIRTQRGIAVLIAANDNMFSTLEQMAREIRIGRVFTVSNLPPKISFNNKDDALIEYTYVTGGSAGWIERSVNGGVPQKITADNVNIRSFKIIPKGEGASDGFPTRITLALSIGALGVPSVVNAFTDIETTITVRNLDN